MMTKPLSSDQYHKITRIAGKAIDMGLIMPSKGVQFQMDLEVACNQFDIDLDKFLKFDVGNFIHDATGIRKHIDRPSKTFLNCFVPRCVRN